MQDWGFQLKEKPHLHSNGSYQTSPRLRHTTSRDWTCFPPSEDNKHGGVLASPMLPLLSPEALNRIGSRSYSDPSRSSLFGGVNWTVQSPLALARLQATLWNSKIAWLVLYFVFNLLLTLSNKSVLTGFPFPYTLTSLHALCSTLGGLFLRWHGLYVPKRLRGDEEMALAVFSFLYGLNIAVSNVSLNLVTVPVSCPNLICPFLTDIGCSFTRWSVL